MAEGLAVDRGKLLSLAGVLIAFLNFAPDFQKQYLDQTEQVQGTWLDGPIPAMVAFAGLIALLALVGSGTFLAPRPDNPSSPNGKGDSDETFPPQTPASSWQVEARRSE